MPPDRSLLQYNHSSQTEGWGHKQAGGIKTGGIKAASPAAGAMRSSSENPYRVMQAASSSFLPLGLDLGVVRPPMTVIAEKETLHIGDRQLGEVSSRLDLVAEDGELESALGSDPKHGAVCELLG